MGKPGITRPVKMTGASICLFLAALLWNIQEQNAALHSPVATIIGTVRHVSVNTHKHGAIDDDFQVQLPDGSQSPVFSTDWVADSLAQQPLHTGDLLNIEYRLWDKELIFATEIEGTHTGWIYRRRRDWILTIGATILLIPSLIWLLVALLRGQKSVHQNAL